MPSEKDVGMRIGGIVLCGGQSRRMGSSKANLPFGEEVMLTRVVRLLRLVVEPIVVVAASQQELPDLPHEVRIVRDQHQYRGPLEGIYGGLCALDGHVDAAYVTGCDVPLLVPGFVRRLVELLEENDVVVPMEGPHHHPLAAIYRTRVLREIAPLLAAEQLRPVLLYENVATRKVPIDSLREVDPELLTLRNVNRPEEYAEVLRLAGLEEG